MSVVPVIAHSTRPTPSSCIPAASPLTTRPNAARLHRLGWEVLVALATLLTPQTVQAQPESEADAPQELAAEVTFSARTTQAQGSALVVRACGNETSPESEDAERRGVALVVRAVRSQPPDSRLLGEALLAFEQQCNLRDDRALERRAAVLYLLGRHLDAARTLDAFLAAHPPASLQGDLRARVEANQDLYLQAVASLRIESDVPGASITVNDSPKVPLDGRVLRCPPGVVSFEVSARGYAPVRRSVEVVAGEISNLRVELNTRERAELPPPVAFDAERAGGAPTDAPSKLWPVVLLGTGGALLAVGVAGTIMRSDRAQEYSDGGCGGAAPRPGCTDVASEHSTAQVLQIGGFALGGAMLTGGLIWLLSGESSPDDKPKAHAGIACSPGLGAAASVWCTGRF